MPDPVLITSLLAGGWNTLTFEPFRDGITIARLLDGAPAVAVLRYAPGAQVPLHEHQGAEMIVVLEGSQSDERGTYGKGDVIINPAGTRHSVWSDEGCVVLLHWALPVRFIDESSVT